MKLKEYPYDKYKSSKMRVIIDTDCACEGDDAFAIAHALITSKFEVKAILAANFVHLPNSVEMSYNAIHTLVDKMGMTGQTKVLRGSMPMKSETEYESSEAVDFIIEEAMKDDPRPLFVCVQCAITNLAIALTKKPEIAHKIQCIWIGGGAYPYGGFEFNLCNDVVAVRTVMNSDVRLWQVPGNVYSKMRVTFMTLYNNLKDCGEAGNYLCEQLWACNKEKCDLREQGLHHFTRMPLTEEELNDPDLYTTFGNGECWIMGDSPVVGLMLNSQPGDRISIGAPGINDDGSYTLNDDNPRKIYVYQTIDSQNILNDFFDKMKFQYEK